MLVCTPNAAHALRRTVGTLNVQPGTAPSGSLVGKNSNGEFKTSGSECYSSQFAMRLTIGFIGSMTAIVEPLKTATAAVKGEPATDDLYPVGTAVELWWYADNEWYKGTVVDTRVRKGRVHGESISRREIQVRYDADDTLLWHALCDYSI